MIVGELKAKDVLTMEDMLSCIGKKIGEGRQEHSEVAILERIVDWKKCVEPHFKDKEDSLVGHTNPHYFKFNFKNGKPMMQWKYYSIDGDGHWRSHVLYYRRHHH